MGNKNEVLEAAARRVENVTHLEKLGEETLREGQELLDLLGDQTVLAALWSTEKLSRSIFEFRLLPPGTREDRPNTQLTETLVLRIKQADGKFFGELRGVCQIYDLSAHLSHFDKGVEIVGGESGYRQYAQRVWGEEYSINMYVRGKGEFPDYDFDLVRSIGLHSLCSGYSKRFEGIYKTLMERIQS